MSDRRPDPLLFSVLMIAGAGLLYGLILIANKVMN